MSAGDFIEILRQVNTMEEQRFWGVIALCLVALVVYLVKHKVWAKATIDVAGIKAKETGLKEASSIVQVGVLAAALAFIAKMR